MCFFSDAVQEQAEENLLKATAILDLYNQKKSHFVELTHSQYAIHALDWIFERPIFKSSDFIRSTSIPRPTAQRILNVLKSENILKTVEESSGRKSAVLAYTDLLNIAEGYQAF